MIPIVRPVILSGGAGTRLWPLSTERRPKQFLDLLGEPLFEATLTRLRGVEGVRPATVVTGADHLSAVEEVAKSASVGLDTIVIEPVGRNTAPAVVAAALISDPEDILVVLPSDHTIGDPAAFRSAMERAISIAAGGALVVFGTKPTRPETGYGYIEMGEPLESGFRVARFKEKPDVAEAEKLFEEGRHLWNCGMFVFTARRLLEETRQHDPDLVERVAASVPPERSGRLFLAPSFAEVTPISIDHAVMEKTDRAVVIPIDVGWSDVGSWQSMWELSEHDKAGNVLLGNVTAIDVNDSYVLAGSRMVAIAGVEGLVVIETPHAVLVLPRDRAQLVRDLVARSATDRASD